MNSSRYRSKTMISLVFTPAAFRPSITSSISSEDEFASGLPTGFILIPTTSPGSKNDRQAPTPSSDPVRPTSAESSVFLIAERSLTPSRIIAGFRASTTRPG